MSRLLLGPMSELQQMIDYMDRSLHAAWPEGMQQTQSSQGRVFSLAVDIWEKGDAFFVRAALPGVRPENLDVQVEDNVLTLSGEIRHESEADREARFWRREHVYGKFTRSVRLPENVKIDEIEASFDNGFVTVTVPKAAEKPKARRVPIRAQGQDQEALERDNSESRSRNGKARSETRPRDEAGAAS
jgi:HSP20 family protein